MKLNNPSVKHSCATGVNVHKMTNSQTSYELPYNNTELHTSSTDLMELHFTEFDLPVPSLSVEYVINAFTTSRNLLL